MKEDIVIASAHHPGPCSRPAVLEWRRALLSLPLPTVSRPAEQQCSIGGGLCSARHPKLLVQQCRTVCNCGPTGMKEVIITASAHHPGPFSHPAVQPCSSGGGPCRRRLCPPSSGARQPLIQQCRRAKMRAHLTPPPLPTTRRCSSASRLAVQQCHCAQCEPTEESKHGAMSSFPKQYCFALFYPEYEF